jgi:hypothetical protein
MACLAFSTFFSLLSPLYPLTLDLHRQEPERDRWWRVVAGAAAGPLAGARVQSRVSAPLLSGSVTVPRPCPSRRPCGGGPVSARLAMSKTRGMHQVDPGVVMTVGEAFEGLSLSSILFVHFSLVYLGLGVSILHCKNDSRSIPLVISQTRSTT